MSRFITFLILALLLAFLQAAAQPQFELSRNVYRIPYESGEEILVRQDHFTHSPTQGRYDIRANGADDCNSHRIVAAAEGEVMRVVEDNNVSCPDCGESNNYVWIRHANDEWTKYTHFRRNSVTVSVGDQVCAGTILGYECWVGATSPAEWRHLHFEVRRPNDPANPVITTSGGFMDPSDGAHLIPVFNSFSKHYFEQDDEHTATNSNACTQTDISLVLPTIVGNNDIRVYMASNTINHSPGATLLFGNGANGMVHAGESITLSPGFTASTGSYFHARIGSCATTNFPGGCN